MRRLLTALCLLGMVAGVAMAANPDRTFGPAGNPINLPVREDVCQYGFSDDTPGSGWTLGFGQQLGIHCPGPIQITGVGFYIEFMVTYGELDIVILDGGVEVQRTATYPDAGVNEFDVPDINVGDACIMLCPVGDYWSVLGEDYTSPPYGSSYWSNTCQCTNAFGDNNLTVWAYTGGVVPTSTTSWGSIRALYR